MQDQSPAIYGNNSNQIDSLIQKVWSYSEDIGMKFGIDKCAVLELEIGRVARSEGIARCRNDLRGRSGRVQVFQLDKVMNNEMKESIGKYWK